MEFLQTLRQFFMQSDYPKMTLSDNGNQMIGAEKLEGLANNPDEGFSLCLNDIGERRLNTIGMLIG